jgi:hypothetical protein
MPPRTADSKHVAFNDQADAALVAAVANAVAAWRATTQRRRSDLKLLREAVWYYWERPRLPRPLVAGKYPRSVPWSAAAREAYAMNPKRPGGLVIEHSRPTTVTLNELLDAAPLDATGALSILGVAGHFVVITREENAALERAGVGRGGWDQRDPLGRYRTAGLDVGRFEPLPAED